MNNSDPKLLIIARREAAGDELPDFSGPGFSTVRKEMILGHSDKDHAQLTDGGSPAEKLQKMAARIADGAENQEAFAEELLALAREMGGELTDSKGVSDIEDESQTQVSHGCGDDVGQRRELK
jgi:hypothetical protein